MKTIILFSVLALISCTPAQQSEVKTVEQDLCKSRAVFRALEAADSSLAPAPDSTRAKVEGAEDKLCAMAQ